MTQMDADFYCAFPKSIWNLRGGLLKSFLHHFLSSLTIVFICFFFFIEGEAKRNLQMLKCLYIIASISVYLLLRHCMSDSKLKKKSFKELIYRKIKIRVFLLSKHTFKTLGNLTKIGSILRR
jgi:hypothetical protein